jgi:triphosphoribosyl-dephospho-CoA synthase
MRLAADRDLIARQYANGFREVFDVGVRAIVTAEQAGLNWEQVVIRCHLELMARHPDTLIARKRGLADARESANRAAAVLAAGWPASEQSQRLLSEFDGWLRAVGHERNPGATADLVAASLFVALREGRMGVAHPTRGNLR